MEETALLIEFGTGPGLDSQGQERRMGLETKHHLKIYVQHGQHSSAPPWSMHRAARTVCPGHRGMCPVREGIGQLVCRPRVQAIPAGMRLSRIGEQSPKLASGASLPNPAEDSSSQQSLLQSWGLHQLLVAYWRLEKTCSVKESNQDSKERQKGRNRNLSQS